MPRPLVGICAAVEQARFGPWNQLAVLLPRSYVGAVQDGGGIAVLLAPDRLAAESPDELLGRFDALLLAGGVDVDPETYGASPHPETRSTDPERDRFELALTKGALERDLPLLGICRGMQVMNVATGGTLVQHLPEAIGDERHRPMLGAFGEHDVRLEPGSLAARAAGAERLTVKTHHHQGLAELGEGLVPSGWSEDDDQVEAVELPDRSFALGVLWHAEESEDSVISSFVESVAGS